MRSIRGGAVEACLRKGLQTMRGSASSGGCWPGRCRRMTKASNRRASADSESEPRGRHDARDAAAVVDGGRGGVSVVSMEEGDGETGAVGRVEPGGDRRESGAGETGRVVGRSRRQCREDAATRGETSPTDQAAKSRDSERGEWPGARREKGCPVDWWTERGAW